MSDPKCRMTECTTFGGPSKLAPQVGAARN